jgi:hypothetical protein
MAKLNVRIDDSLDEALEIAVAKRKTTKQAATASALAEWLQRAPINSETTSIHQASALNEDERDILAMLRERPDRDFLFSSLQTTVRHALEQYRRKWKAEKTEATKEKTASKSRQPERRSTGTR